MTAQEEMEVQKKVLSSVKRLLEALSDSPKSLIHRFNEMLEDHGLEAVTPEYFPTFWGEDYLEEK